jgi:citrate lyase beta subunit
VWQFWYKLLLHERNEFSMHATRHLEAGSVTICDRSSLFTLGLVDDEIVEMNGLDFDVAAYSRFKYCDGEVTAFFGMLLARRLISLFGPRLTQSYVAASGFKQVPTAAYHVLGAVVASLTVHGYPPKGVFRIDRGVVRAVDYSGLSYEERLESNASRRVTLPEVSRHEITDSPVIVIDDIRVSGGTEDETRRILNEAGIQEVFYAYLAEIPQELGRSKSTLEHRLAHAAVQTLVDLVPIICSNNFKINARTCKFILRAPAADLAAFVEAVPVEQLRQIAAALVADGYHLMPEHAESYQALQEALNDHLPNFTTTLTRERVVVPGAPLHQGPFGSRPQVMSPVLYSPATTSPATLLELANGLRPDIRRVAFCTEDAVDEQDVPRALDNLRLVLTGLDPASDVEVFIRLRDREVMRRLLVMPGIDRVTGFVIPKANDKGFPKYANAILERSDAFRIMPILEHSNMTNPYFRDSLLAVLTQAAFVDNIDCVRLGGNDLMGHQYLRRDDAEFTIYDTVVGKLIADIVNEFRGTGHLVVTAPVFGCYGSRYDELFRREVRQNIANGLFGQTVIHPSQLRVILELYKVRQADFDSAQALTDTAVAVVGRNGKMDERATDLRWAQATLLRAELFGVRPE